MAVLRAMAAQAVRRTLVTVVVPVVPGMAGPMVEQTAVLVAPVVTAAVMGEGMVVVRGRPAQIWMAMAMTSQMTVMTLTPR